MGRVEPYAVSVAEDTLVDLRDRLRRTRWPEAETVDDWSQGTPLKYLQKLCEYWAEEYDWRRCEARLNAMPQVRVDVDGLGIHVLHARSPHPDAMPLVLTHGWPGSIIEFLEVIGPLTDPVANGEKAQDAFHVICPTLPGYGFSDKPQRTGWGLEAIADAWAEIMSTLGYERFAAQGGDWGSMVTSVLAQRHAERLIGIHLNMPLAFPVDGGGDLGPDELAAMERLNHYRQWGSGYSEQQATRPQTLGYGLVDSPAGQCAWVVEKFFEWTDCDGDLENTLTPDQLLDNVMLYWLPGTGASSARLYWESLRTLDFAPVHVPTGISVFPREILQAPRSWCEGRFTDLRYWNELDRGGHFAAFEQPGLFVEELRASFRTMR